jgi:hypothetical protein
MTSSPPLRRRWTQTRSFDDHSFFDCPFADCKVCEGLERKANREVLAYGFALLIIIVVVVMVSVAMIQSAAQRNPGEMLRPLPLSPFSKPAN